MRASVGQPSGPGTHPFASAGARVNSGRLAGRAAAGLQPSSKGVRVRFDGTKRTVVEGPFPETKDLVAGFWLWQAKSKDEAVEWLERAPFEHEEVEIRQVFEAEDFGPALTPELRKQEERLRPNRRGEVSKGAAASRASGVLDPHAETTSGSSTTPDLEVQLCIYCLRFTPQSFSMHCGQSPWVSLASATRER